MQSSFKTDRNNGASGHKSQVQRPTVVILGAGFGGLWATRAFAKRPVNVVLIDRHNYHTFLPLLYQVGAAELEPENIAQPLRKIFWNQTNVRFQLGELRGIDYSAKTVQLTNHQVHYDYLVIATGHSRRQVVAMSEEIDRKLEQDMGDTRLNVAGKQEGRWIVLDYGDVVIHLFDDETRMFYSLENLWADAKRVDLTQTLAGLK